LEEVPRMIWIIVSITHA